MPKSTLFDQHVFLTRHPFKCYLNTVLKHLYLSCGNELNWIQKKKDLKLNIISASLAFSFLLSPIKLYPILLGCYALLPHASLMLTGHSCIQESQADGYRLLFVAMPFDAILVC